MRCVASFSDEIEGTLHLTILAVKWMIIDYLYYCMYTVCYEVRKHHLRRPWIRGIERHQKDRRILLAWTCPVCDKEAERGSEGMTSNIADLLKYVDARFRSIEERLSHLEMITEEMDEWRPGGDVPSLPGSMEECILTHTPSRITSLDSVQESLLQWLLRRPSRT